MTPRTGLPLAPMRKETSFGLHTSAPVGEWKPAFHGIQAWGEFFRPGPTDEEFVARTPLKGEVGIVLGLQGQYITGYRVPPRKGVLQPGWAFAIREEEGRECKWCRENNPQRWEYWPLSW